MEVKPNCDAIYKFRLNSNFGGLRQSLPLSTRKSAASRLRQTMPDLIFPPKSTKFWQSPAVFYKSAGLLKNSPEFI